jgi:hypothetical protein
LGRRDGRVATSEASTRLPSLLLAFVWQAFVEGPLNDLDDVLRLRNCVLRLFDADGRLAVVGVGPPRLELTELAAYFGADRR